MENGQNEMEKQKDTADLIKKIEKFIALTYKNKRAMGLFGRCKIEKEFDRQIVVSDYMDELKKREGFEDVIDE